MRNIGDMIDIDSTELQDFFQTRAGKFDAKHPYVTTLYQDKSPENSDIWNSAETELILPKLEINSKSRILDVACGVGRWADNLVAARIPYEHYLGIDSTKELIDIASIRHHKRKNTDFITISANSFKGYFIEHSLNKYNRVIISGLFQYLNDNELIEYLNSLQEITTNDTIIYILTSISNIGQRLTLKDIYSDELMSKYNAIYRTIVEYNGLFRDYLSDEFSIIEENEVFKPEKKIHERIETSQHYWIIKRQK